MLACCNAPWCVKATKREKDGIPTCHKHGGKTVRATPSRAEIADFAAFCWNASDLQLRSIVEKENAAGRKRFAEVARNVIATRGGL